VRKIAFSAVQRISALDLSCAARMAAVGTRQAKLDAIAKVETAASSVLAEFSDYSVAPGTTVIMKGTAKGVFVGSHPQSTFDAFNLIGLERHRRLAELGSGTGLVGRIASLFVPEVILVEEDRELMAVSRMLDKRVARFIPEVGHIAHIRGDYTRMNNLYRTSDVFFNFVDGDSQKLAKKHFARLSRPGSIFILKSAKEIEKGGIGQGVQDITASIPHFDRFTKAEWFVYRKA